MGRGGGDYESFFDSFFGGFFGDYEDGSGGGGGGSLWDWITYFFPDGNIPPNFGSTASYYNTSCYAKSINVYGTCSNGTMSYNWIDLGGGLQTTIDLLQPDCTQDCRANSGQDVWYRYSYASRQSDSRNGTRDQCAYVQDFFRCQVDTVEAPPPLEEDSPPPSQPPPQPSRPSSPPSGPVPPPSPDVPPQAPPAAPTTRHRRLAQSDPPSEFLGFDSMLDERSVGRAQYAVCGKTCAPDCSQAMVGDGRPDPACNYAACCYDGADYEVWVMSKMLMAQRLALINTEDSLQESARLLGEVCNLQKTYDVDPYFGDQLQRLVVVGACRLQLSVLSGSDITGVNVPNVLMQLRSDFKASFEGMLSAIKDLESAMADINEIGDKYVQLLQQYFYRSADDPTNWAALQPTYHGQQLEQGERNLQTGLAAAYDTTYNDQGVGQTLARETQDTLVALAAAHV